MICPGCGKMTTYDGFRLCAECNAKRGVSHERSRMESVIDICEKLRSGGYAPLAHRIEEALKRERGNAAKRKKHRRTKTDDPARYLQAYWRDHYEV